MGRDDDEGPQHSVTVGSFYMKATEVTQKEWREVMGSNPSYFKGDDRPVESVSWFDAVKYCNALSKKEGRTPVYRINGESVTANWSADGYRLPTEAEWEYAARGGTTTAIYTGSLTIRGLNNAPALDAISWYGGNSGYKYPYSEGYDSSGWSEKQYNHNKAGTRKVGQKRPNPYGLYDMLGNVWEWCWDWYGDYSSGSQIDPGGPSSGVYRVSRGGSWDYYGRLLRSANRGSYSPGNSTDRLGFRPVRRT